MKRAFRGFRLLPVLAWLAVQGAMLAAPIAVLPAGAQATMAALGLQHITICTPSGLKTVGGDELPGTSAPCDHCTMLGATPVPPCAAMADHRFSAEITWRPRTAPLAKVRRSAPFSSRAPPLLSSA